MNIEPDKVRDGIGANAQACLDHVRSVGWGEGSACYETADGDTMILVTLSVRSTRRKDKSDAG